MQSADQGVVEGAEMKYIQYIHIYVYMCICMYTQKNKSWAKVCVYILNMYEI